MGVADEGVWDEDGWTRRRDAHHARVDAWLAPQRERRARGIAHPVEDFLFDYYSFRPYQLRRWHPGHGVVLGGPAAQELLTWPHYVRSGRGVTVATESLVAARAATLRWVYNLLVSTAGRSGSFGCFGMHEWARVYRLPAEKLRHADWPLRFDEDEVAGIVHERDVRCTHFDAFRFFTPEARPLNALQPSRQTQQDLEQPGCLHAGMDLYKHAYKLSPLVPSDLVADTFALARDIRELDMRASPYDLSALGLAAVPVETPEGRADYARRQRVFAERSAPLRRALIDVIAPLQRD